jgi:hypothetical protein
LTFGEFQEYSLQLQIPVSDLFDHFLQLLGAAADTTKMTQKELQDKLARIKQESLLPVMKFCVWCMAMRGQLSACPAENPSEKFLFLEQQRKVLAAACCCSQCQLGDISQIEKASGSWSCIRNCRRGNKAAAVSFNLLEQHSSAGAPVDFTFCCLCGAAYNQLHEPDRFFRLLSTQPVEMKQLLTGISESSTMESRMSLVRLWLVSHTISEEQLCILLRAGGSVRWKAELLVVAVNRLSCPASELSRCLCSIISSLAGCGSGSACSLLFADERLQMLKPVMF